MKTEIGDSLNDLRGRMGKWVYRRFEGNVVIARRPRPTTNPPTVAQVEQRAFFRLASNYARAVYNDPQRRVVYDEHAKALGRKTVWALIMGDFLHRPTIDKVELAAYDGKVGDLIKITASDDFQVTKVEVSIEDEVSGQVIEQGPAQMGDTHWEYRGQTALARNHGYMLKVVATDRTGNTGQATPTWRSAP